MSVSSSSDSSKPPGARSIASARAPLPARAEPAPTRGAARRSPELESLQLAANRLSRSRRGRHSETSKRNGSCGASSCARDCSTPRVDSPLLDLRDRQVRHGLPIVLVRRDPGSARPWIRSAPRSGRAARARARRSGRSARPGQLACERREGGEMTRRGRRTWPRRPWGRANGKSTVMWGGSRSRHRARAGGAAGNRRRASRPRTGTNTAA